MIKYKTLYEKWLGDIEPNTTLKYGFEILLKLYKSLITFDVESILMAKAVTILEFIFETEFGFYTNEFNFIKKEDKEAFIKSFKRLNRIIEENTFYKELIKDDEGLIDYFFLFLVLIINQSIDVTLEFMKIIFSIYIQVQDVNKIVDFINSDKVQFIDDNNIVEKAFKSIIKTISTTFTNEEMNKLLLNFINRK